MGLAVDDGYPHFFHQEAGVHVLGDAVLHLVGESELVVGDFCFEAIVADVLRKRLDECAQQQVVRGDNAIGLQCHQLLDEGERAFLLVH